MSFAATARACVALLAAMLIVGALPAAAQYPGDNGRIAFTQDGSIVTRSVTNETLKVLGEGSEPNYSASGSKIAYFRYPEFGYEPNIWVMNADGSGKSNVTKNPSVYESVVFAPSGNKLLFSECGSSTPMVPCHPWT